MPFGGWELAIILVIVLLLFGPSRLPQLGKSLGKTMRAIREGTESKPDDEDEEPAPKSKSAKAKAASADEDDDEE